MKFRTLLSSILFAAISSCSITEFGNCKNGTIITTSLERAYGCSNTKYNMDVDLSDDYILIRDQASFTSLVTGDCNPTIDFTAFDLIVGKKQLTTGNDSVEYNLIKNWKPANYF